MELKGLFCINCGAKLHCGCKACHKEGRDELLWKEGELQYCSKCGFTQHCDWWLDRTGEIMSYLNKYSK